MKGALFGCNNPRTLHFVMPPRCSFFFALSAYSGPSLSQRLVSLCYAQSDAHYGTWQARHVMYDPAAPAAGLGNPPVNDTKQDRRCRSGHRDALYFPLCVLPQSPRSPTAACLLLRIAHLRPAWAGLSAMRLRNAQLRCWGDLELAQRRARL